MPTFEKSLVAIDIDQQELTESSLVAAEHAIRFAKMNSGELVFAHAFEDSRMQERMMSPGEGPAQVHYEQVKSLLKGLEARAEERGVKARSRLLFGKAWHQLIQEVLREKHSLLIAGATNRGRFIESLFGSTTMKLLRKCPCPVWVTKQKDPSQLNSILVAHDFSEVGTEALRWGSKLAEDYCAELCVLHCLEPVESFLSTLPAAAVDTERAAAKKRIESELSAHKTSFSAEVVVTEGSAAAQINYLLNSRPIDLLVMGTIARCGLSGFISGNTAETLLPWIRCSMVALKPPDFVSPVQLIR
jgi:universal stress protein E